ncbi:MAG: TIGR03936 family radical SAM-associated protein [Ruminococcus sp.]|nr:TIGR03936 family radical SAM-associated protein [Ruminococcus sp.]
MLQPKNQNLRIEKTEYRLVFEKTGRARYISHLDLMRCFQRLFKRAGAPLWYTQGFNPHAYLMFPLALPLGTSSSVEILDIALTEPLGYDELCEKVNACAPEGLRLVSAAAPVMKHTEIAFAEYEVSFEQDGTEGSVLGQRFSDFLAQEKIEVEKRTKKRGVNLVDIRPHICLLSLSSEGAHADAGLRLPAGSEFNLNTNVVMEAFESFMGSSLDRICTKRTKILTKSLENFI